MDEKRNGETASRRDFLKRASVSASAAALAAVAGKTAEAAALDDESDGMRDTAHARAYYESARF